MKTQPLPDTHREITPELLNSILAPHTDWHEPAITSVSLQPLESPRGTVYKAEAVLADGTRKLLLVKMHNALIPPGSRSHYSGEVYFYKHVAAESRVPVPRTFFAEWDEVNSRQLIVQEFLTDGSIGIASTMLNGYEQKRILRVLARMHARWWNTSELHALTGIRTAAEAMQSGIDRFRSGALDGGTFLERFGGKVHPRIAEYYRAMGTSNTGERLRDGFSSHLTLCHYDVSAKNVFLPDDPLREPVLFDWGLVIRGNVGHELAQFLSASTDPKEHDRLQDLVRFYHRELASNGVGDYSFETLWNDFRYGCLVRLAAPIALTARGNPRADALALTLLPLVSETAISVEAFELLE